jgi:hypothetical protein
MELLNTGGRPNELVPQALVKKLEARGYAIWQDEESERYLDARGANASTYLTKDITLRRDARRLEVLEEYLHNVQNRIGIIKGHEPGANLDYEIHVKDFMLRHQKLLRINDDDAEWLREWLEKAREIQGES